MLSQNVAKSAVPSYYMIRTNLPHRKPQNQWEGVLYYSGITKRQRHLLLLQRKRERAAVLKSFDAYRGYVEGVWDSVATHLRQQTPSSSAVTTGQDCNGAAGPQSHMLFRLACQLGDCGLHAEAVECLHHVESVAAASLDVSYYTAMLRHLSAGRLGECLLHTDAAGDPALPYKLLGDHGGEARAQEAYTLFDTGLAQLAASSTTSSSSSSRSGSSSGGGSYTCSTAATQLANNLMHTLLTCGYRHVKAVPNSVYDKMGALGISPTASTYENVVLALALVGDMRSAEDVMSFLSRHHQDQMSIRGYDALLLGYREAKAYDKCDQVWQELLDRRWPRAAVSTAELYLRSVVDHSYTPTSEPMQRFGDINVVEKRKIPIILTQMETLGIPRVQLTRPLQDEVEDGLRKYSLHKEKFYEWGRAVKQFDFIEFRRRHGWLYDLHLMKNTTKMTPPVRDASQRDASLAPAAVAELPEFMQERYAWEREPLEELLFVQEEKERLDDVRSGDIYYHDSRSVHERSPNWMGEVPQTRYDQLYGISQPDLPKIGIRRHLATEYTNRSHVLERDAALMKKTLARGRRLRHRAEVFQTHRSEVSRVPNPAPVE